MVVADGIAKEETMSIPVDPGHVRGECFGAAIRRIGIDRSCFVLRTGCRSAEDFPAAGGQKLCSAGAFRDVKAQTNVRLTGQMVERGRLDFRHHTPNRCGIREVGIVQKQSTVIDSIVCIQMTQSGSFQCARSTNKAVNFVTLFQQQLCKVRTILASDSRNEGSRSFQFLVFSW